MAANPEQRTPQGPIRRLRVEDGGEATPQITPAASAVLRRRQLLRGGFWTGLAVLTAGGVAAVADFLAPRQVQRFGSRVTVAPHDVPRPGGEPFHSFDGRFWLVNLRPGEGVPDGFEQYGRPSRAGGLLALYDKCTHAGARVPWRDDFSFGGVTGWFRCPSHGATFTKAGLRVFGPAPRSMDTMPILAVTPDGVIVNTSKLLLGDRNDAQRAVPAGPFVG